MGEDTILQLAPASVKCVKDYLTVNGHLDRFPDLQVIKGLNLLVHGKIGGPKTRSGNHLVRICLLETVNLFRHIVHVQKIQLAALKHHGLRFSIRHDFNHNTRKGAGSLEIIIIPYKYKLVIISPAGKLKRSCANGQGRVKAELVPCFLGGLFIVNAHGRGGDTGQKTGIRFLKGKLKGVIIQDFRAFQLSCRSIKKLRGPLNLVQEFGVGSSLYRKHTLKCIFHIAGLQLLAIVELHALSQIKCIFHTVIADIPLLCQTRFNGRGPVIRNLDFTETVIDINGNLIILGCFLHVRCLDIGIQGNVKETSCVNACIAHALPCALGISRSPALRCAGLGCRCAAALTAAARQPQTGYHHQCKYQA